MPDKIKEEELSVNPVLNIFRQTESTMAEGTSQQRTDESLANQRAEREKEEELKKNIQESREKTMTSLAKLQVDSNRLYNAVQEAEDRQKTNALAKQQTLKVPFAIKAANEDTRIEKQVINYIRSAIPKNKIQLEINFNWRNKHEATPLVVFCNYSSRIGVDVQVALRDVQEPKVILIILHYARRALLRGDLSDDDYLLSDDLKQRAFFIAHFAFDDELYDCQQNQQCREKLCNDLQKYLQVE